MMAASGTIRCTVFATEDTLPRGWHLRSNAANSMSQQARHTSPRLLSIEEFARLRESEEHRSELVRGVLVREPRPGAYHGRTQARLAERLNAYVERHDLGSVFTDVGVEIPGQPRTVRGPDIAFYAADRVPDPLPEGFLKTAPDLAIEIVSPSNTASEMLEKVKEYLEAGSSLVWVVDPGSRRTTVYRSPQDSRVVKEGETLDGEEVVPGFRVVLNEVLP